jgi:hypothetical protein
MAKSQMGKWQSSNKNCAKRYRGRGANDVARIGAGAQEKTDPHGIGL